MDRSILVAVTIALLGAGAVRADDCDDDGVDDALEIQMGLAPDCNGNGVPDYCDIWVNGTSTDCDNNGVPDDCEADCNGNGSPDVCDIRDGQASDWNGNG